MTDQAIKKSKFPTSLLLTCAALGVAGGIILAPANWVSATLLATAPLGAVAVAGLWILPSVVALRLLKKPLVGLLVGLIAGLVVAPFSGFGFVSVFTNLAWALPAELPFLVVAYRYWHTWQHYAGAVGLGVLYPFLSWGVFEVGSQPLWAQIGFCVITMASCVGANALGILIADRLRAAGVGNRAAA